MILSKLHLVVSYQCVITGTGIANIVYFSAAMTTASTWFLPMLFSMAREVSAHIQYTPINVMRGFMIHTEE